MLDDENGVPKFFEREECLDESIIVPLMESDRRFVEHIESACEPAPQLRCKSDSLRFASRKSCGRTIESQIIKTDI